MQHLLRMVGTLCLLLGTYVSYSQSLLHYWDFNTSTTEATLLTATSSAISGASITHIPGASPSVILTTSNTTGQDFEAANLNARNGSAAGAHIRLNSPVGGMLVFALPTTGYEQIVAKYVTRRSGSGAATQVVAYSTDGTAFTTFKTITVTEVPTIQTLDFSSITAASNNANFKIRITVEEGIPGNTGGNNRFDNFTLDGVPFGADNAAPTVVFAPANNTENISINTTIKLTFNENIRLVNDATITAGDIASFVELRKTNATGTEVAFTATITGSEILLTPTAALANNTAYYVGLLANKIEDGSNNAITTAESITFKTIAVQTVFQAGDIVPIAYRMNATDIGDEVALLTLVDILPGTRINITDAKYTSNTPAQCAGGLVWTAPASGVAAGTVIVIGNDANTASIGTLTGSTFGLSSGGDQFIVYTGTNTTPNYITALSSNAWAVANISCSGSNSLLPAALSTANSISLSTAPNSTEGNLVNAYYNGPHTGATANLRASILNPANWVGVAGSTVGQTWPAWSFPGPPTILSVTVLNQTQLRVIFNSNMDAASVTTTANYAGISGISGVTVTNNGTKADTAIVTYSSPFAAGSVNTLTIDGVKNDNNRGLFAPYKFTFTYNTTLAWDKTHVIGKETDGTISIKIKITNPSAGTVDVVLKPATFNTATTADFTFATQTITLTGTESEKTITIPVINDTQAEADEYFVLELQNASSGSITGSPMITIFIKDNDMLTPQLTESISLKFTSRFAVANPNKEEGIAEIVAYDPVSKRLFTISTGIDKVDIINFSDPAHPVSIKQIDMTSYGKGLTSVAVKNEIVAVTVTGLNNEQENGSVVFFTTDGVFINKVTAGALPDMVTFTPNGNYVLTANEGQPNDSYSIDPEGSVSIINISGGVATLTQSNVTTIDFTAFNAQETALRAAGVRKTQSTSTLSQDLEPEYITVSADSKKAWVSLQENNAIAEINLETLAITSIKALGTKDYSLSVNGFDASDNNSGVVISSWPVKGFYMPDAIANYTIGSTTYLVTANEGDEKEYGTLVERTTVGAVKLDAAKFPNAAALQQSHNLGRFRISNLQGDTDNDGDYDELYAVGARSFSIWNASTGALVYDSGSDFERITEKDPQSAAVFNADNGSNAFKNRSRAKGPEPEGITLAKIGTKTFAFITLERTGGIMVYDITDPASASFVQYVNSRDLTTFAGDNGPEGIIFIDAATSPNAKPYVISANEMSGTLAIFEVLNATLPTSVDAASTESAALLVYPNPTKLGKIYFSEAVSGKIIDLTGAEVGTINNTTEANVQQLSKGIYIVVMNSGQTAKFIIE